jgi:steroid delta-isomerase-like uncharacterized protein
VSTTDVIAENEALVRRVFEDVINARDPAAADEICSDDFVIHVPGLELPVGAEGLKGFVQSLRGGFPDLHVVIDDVIATEDGAAVRWHTDRQTHTGEYRGLPPTGRPVAVTGITFHRIKGGRVTSTWVEADSIGLGQQLGVVPPDDLGSGAKVRFILGSIFRLAYLQARHSARSGSRRRA